MSSAHRPQTQPASRSHCILPGRGISFDEIYLSMGEGEGVERARDSDFSLQSCLYELYCDQILSVISVRILHIIKVANIKLAARSYPSLSIRVLNANKDYNH